MPEMYSLTALEAEVQQPGASRATPYGGHREGAVPSPLLVPSTCWYPRLATSLQALPLLSCTFGLSLSPLRCVPYKEICHWLWGSLVLVSRPVTEVHLQRPCFQGRQPFPSLRCLGVQFKLIRQIQLPRNHSISSVTFLPPFGNYLFLCSNKHEMIHVSQVSPGGLSHFRILFTCCLVTSAL